MASMREYLENMEAEQLVFILEIESRGNPRYDLPTIWLMCDVLAGKQTERGPTRQIFLDFCARFADSRE